MDLTDFFIENIYIVEFLDLREVVTLVNRWSQTCGLPVGVKYDKTRGWRSLPRNVQGSGLQPQYSVSRLPCPAFACAQLGQGYVQNCVLRVGFQPLSALCFVREKDFHKVWAGTL